MRKYDVGFAAAGSIMTIIFFIVVNYLTSPHDLWFIYPAFAIGVWPISLYCLKNGKHKQLSIFISVLLIMMLVIENYLYSPDIPWFLYALCPLVAWPICVYLGKRSGTMKAALAGSLFIILYYSLLNIILSPQYPWAIYPAFVVLWWPLSIYHVRKKAYIGLSINASLLIITFFITVNVVSTPGTIWAIYPIFCVLWWPLSMYYFVFKRRREVHKSI